MEDNYIKYINNNIGDNDNIDNRLRGIMNNIRIILTKLGNIVTNVDRWVITKELYELEQALNNKKHT